MPERFGITSEVDRSGAGFTVAPEWRHKVPDTLLPNGMADLTTAERVPAIVVPEGPAVWEPDREADVPSWPIPPLTTALWRGVRCLCPACGETKAFRGYLTVVPECANCGAPLGQYRADDAPPYFTILIVGHLLAPVIFFVETTYHPALGLQAAVWLPVCAVFTLALLRPVKGATLGLMLRLGMVKTEGS